jgi:starch synthase (maltosyl-transferring)
MEARPREPGSEEYLDSEKYELRHWDLERPESLRAFIALLNRIRRENPALHSDWSLRFFPTDNDQLVCYAKIDEEHDNVVVTAVNLDPRNIQSGWVELDLAALGIESRHQYQMHDLLTEARYLWEGPRNFVELDPARAPAHIFRVRRRLHREQDFDYFA